MNGKVKTAWTTALRSGDYRQISNKLSSRHSDPHNFGFCCLGVLCELAVDEGKTQVRGIEGAETQYGDYDSSNWPAGYVPRWASGSLPPSVQQWSGLGSPNPMLAYYDPSDVSCDEEGIVRCSLSDLNDREGKTFSEIADIIDAHL